MLHSFLQGAAANSIMIAVAGIGGVFSDEALVFSLIGGAFCGSFFSLWIDPPRDRKDATYRGIGAVLMAFVFAPIILRWRGWPLEVEIIIAVSASVAVASWFGVLAVRKMDIPERIKRILDKKLGNE